MKLHKKTTVLDAMRDALRKIESGDIAEDRLGICHNLTVELEKSFDEGSRVLDHKTILVFVFVGDTFERLQKSWEHYSGTPDFPIPSPNDQSASSYYLDYGNPKWAGRGLEMRLSLIRHLVSNL